MPADTFTLSGKTALITGSGRENGIGAAIAMTFARNGASVAIHHVSDATAPRAAALAAYIATKHGVKTIVVRGPVDSPEAGSRLVKETLEGLGASRLDILGRPSTSPSTATPWGLEASNFVCLVNNGAILEPTQSLLEVTPERLQANFDTNVFSVVYLTQAAIVDGGMPRGGRVLNIGSIASKIAPMLSPIYNATKSALDSLTAGWAGEVRRLYTP